MILLRVNPKISVRDAPSAWRLNNGRNLNVAEAVAVETPIASGCGRARMAPVAKLPLKELMALRAVRSVG
jgi:hypothetical protein